MELKRVVVTGLGAITPIGNNVKEFWDGLVSGRNGAGAITRFDSSPFKTHFACEVKGFDAEKFFDKKEVRKYDLYAQFALVAADEAISEAGISAENTDLEEAGVIWTSGIGGISSFYSEVSDFAKSEGTSQFNPFFIPKMILNMPAGLISIKYGFRGPNFATVSACASSSHAIVEAYNYIHFGKAPVIIAGGTEASITETGVGGFTSMRALSTRNDDPLTASRPFDLNRDGFVMGEGGGGIVLEEMEHALRRGAHIYAELVGTGISADAYHITSPHPEGYGAILSMKRALADAGLAPQDIDHINAHATSTPAGDIAEPIAIKAVFGDHTPSISINATKSMTGHLLGGAGVVESIATILAIQNATVPPTINHFDDDPQIVGDFDFTFNKARKREVNAAITNAFGFGGHNASIVFKKFSI
ncbi:MAG: beta-ketoacyl-ACP synthase II [Candidatus Limimorpha sp.]